MSSHSSNIDEPCSNLEFTASEKTWYMPPPPYPPSPTYHAETWNTRDLAEKHVVVKSGPESPNHLARTDSLEKWLATDAIEHLERRKDTRHKKIRICAIIIVALVLVGAIVGAVAGGVLSKHSKSEPSTSTASPSPIPSPTPTMYGPAVALASYAFPTAVSWGYPHLEVFAINELSWYPEWKYRQSDTDPDYSNWQPDIIAGQFFNSLGGEAESAEFGIAATARSGTDVDIFMRAADQSLQWKHHNTSMFWDPLATTWNSLSGLLFSPPTSISWAADRIDVFAINIAYGLSQIWWTAEDGWHEWVNFTSQFSWLTHAPTVVSCAPNRYDIFLVGADDQALYHRYYDGAWQTDDFESLGGYCTSRPVAVSRQEDQIDVFVRGGDAGLWHMSLSRDGQWSNWTSISGNTSVQGEPEVIADGSKIADGSNYLQVFAWGIDNKLLHKTYNAQTDMWEPEHGFETLADEDLAGPPKAVYDGRDIHVFAYLQSGDQLGHKTWDGAANMWTPAEGFELLGTV